MRTWAAIPTCALAVAVLATGQNPKPPAPAAPESDDPTRISIDVTRVSMPFTVTDKKGRFVTGLTREDFEVIENKRTQNILEFLSENDLPLRLAILIDTSNSIRDRFKFEQEAASEFIKGVLRERHDKAMVGSFDTQYALVADMMDNTDKLDVAIRGLRPGGGTALFDAIYYSCRDKLAQDLPKYKYRRAIVLVSDGEDNASKYTRDQALEMAAKAEVVIYAISTNISRISTDGDKLLRYFTSETGGRAFFPFKAEEMQQSFQDIASELRHQYNISYRPNPLISDGLFHPIDLRVKGRKDIIIHARKGYYADRR
jgi:VWFA-related protein